MGEFYVGCYVNGAQPESIRTWLDRSPNDSGFIGPLENGWLYISSKQLETQSQDIIDAYGCGFSKHFGAVLAVLMHDGDLFSADLYLDAQRASSFNSCPGYFDPSAPEAKLRPELQNPEAYASVIQTGLVVELRSKLTAVSDAFAYHELLTEYLGLPKYALGAGYRYISKGEFPNTPWLQFGTTA